MLQVVQLEYQECLVALASPPSHTATLSRGCTARLTTCLESNNNSYTGAFE